MRSKRVLLVLKHFLGDAVMATPLLDALLAAGAEVRIATTPTIGDLLRAPDRSFDFLPMDRPKKLVDTWAAAKLMREGRYDVAILVNRSLRSALAARLAGVKVRSGHSTDHRRFLLTAALPYDLERNESESYLDLARIVDFQTPLIEARLYVGPEEKARGKELLEGADVALQPGASFIGKRFSIPTLCDLAAQLQERGFKVALIGGSDELYVLDELMSELKTPVVNLVGKTSIRETLGLLVNLRLAIGADTGLMHLAAGAGCPTITVFSGKPPTKWAHDYPPHRYLLAPEGGRMSLVTADLVLASVDRSPLVK